jgi:hypothetical protein
MSTSAGWSRALVLLAILWLLVIAVGPVKAQDAGFPPWPIIYDGTVEVDGEPLSSGTLTAHVGDWTSVAVPVVDGWFACADPCLIVGPPTFEYVGAEVTFHLESVNRAAVLKFEFPNLSEPERKTEMLSFSTDPAVPTWLLGLAGLLAIGVGGGVVALMFRRGDGD